MYLWASLEKRASLQVAVNFITDKMHHFTCKQDVKLPGAIPYRIFTSVTGT